ncbi:MULTISPECIES: DUF2498 family protein [Tatumella]|uniref:YciN family protein n=2 Tax=Tatumella ptyseos TaxID=82987 RepID=A0A085JEF3_9GAMM|nr:MULTISPECIES: DUF2498 family protein [Tatumella]KFD18849.1 YciN family protein [Tatumella ptyseos ATCC 33301]SQK75011.1 Protein of uncharacterised function (DUF2498) [Tatumella ptyseos]
MSEHPEYIDKTALLNIANQSMTGHDDYFSAMQVTGVDEKNGLLMFSGPLFTDAQGLPTRQTTAVFNVFKFLTLNLSSRYRLKQ